MNGTLTKSRNGGMRAWFGGETPDGKPGFDNFDDDFVEACEGSESK